MQNRENHEKHKAKARLLKALADDGIDGEKVTAQKKLDEHLKKYNLTIGDIDDSVNNRRLRVSNEDDRMIFVNIILSVNPYARIINLNNSIDVNLDDEDFQEVKNKLRHFVKLWRQEKEILTMAFFHKHKEHFQPDEICKNKWRAKHQENQDLKDAKAKAEELNEKLSKTDILEMDDSLRVSQEKLQRMAILAETLRDAEYNRIHKSINI